MTDSHFKIEKLNLLIFIQSFYSVLFKAGLMRLSEGLKKRSHSLKLSQIRCDRFL
ncbi:hypothetical protein [Nostoc sp.]|uniref:hypothetical protein n=1 Tax=Nostoc sp. TaxID=1180 RepID=UPI002FFB9464